MLEKSLVMVKPHAMGKWQNIISDLEKGQKGGANKIHETIALLPEDFLREFYAPNYERYPSFGEIMEREFIDKSAYFAVYEGEGIVKLNRELVGPTYVSENPKDTIRGKYGRQFIKEGNGILILSNGEKIVKNVIHATSEEPGEFEREYGAFIKYLI